MQLLSLMKACTTCSLLFFTILSSTEATGESDHIMRREVLTAKSSESATKAGSKVDLGTEADRSQKVLVKAADGTTKILKNGDYITLRNKCKGDADGFLSICNDCDGVAQETAALPPPAQAQSGATFLGDACVFTANKCLATPFRIIKVGYDPEEATRDDINHRDLVMLKRDHDPQNSESRYSYLGSGGEGSHSTCSGSKASGMARMYQGTVQNEIAFEGNHLPVEFMWTIANADSSNQASPVYEDTEGIFLTKVLPATDAGGYLAICDTSGVQGADTTCGAKDNVITRPKFSKTDTTSNYNRMKWEVYEIQSNDGANANCNCKLGNGNDDTAAESVCNAPHADKTDWTEANQGYTQGGGTPAPTPPPTAAPVAGTTAPAMAERCAVGFTTAGVNGPYYKMKESDLPSNRNQEPTKMPYENQAKSMLMFWSDSESRWEITSHDTANMNAIFVTSQSVTSAAHTSCDVSMAGCGLWQEQGAENDCAKMELYVQESSCSTAASGACTGSSSATQPPSSSAVFR